MTELKQTFQKQQQDIELKQHRPHKNK